MINNLRLRLSKTVLTLYRWSALALLYGILGAVLYYLVFMGFYLTANCWIAPTLISPSDTQILQLTQTLVTSEQTIGSLQTDIDRQNVTTAEMLVQKSHLNALASELESAVVLERKNDAVNGHALQTLNIQKSVDNDKMKTLAAQTQETSSQIAADLQAGLITKGDAAIQRAQLQTFMTGYTDSRISEVELRDEVRQKLTVDGPLTQILAQKAQLDTQIATLEVGIVTGQEQIRTDRQQISQLQNAMKIARQTPYYRASVSPNMLAFAFVPYDNEAGVIVGAPIYACYLQFVACRKVGTVERIFTDEEHAIHPVFKTQMRGFLIQLALTHKTEARATVLFTRKPFWF